MKWLGFARSEFWINLLAVVRGGMISFRTRDDWESLLPSDVLFIRHDGDCGFIHEGRAYSHLLDSVRELCDNNGLSTAVLASPYSKFLGPAAHGSPVSVNREIFRITVAALFLRVLRGATVARRWSTDQRKSLWNKIVKRCDPIAVLTIQPDPALCRACRVAGIPVYELQHGVIDDGHAIYGLQRRKQVSSEDLPTVFLVWDESSADVLNQWVPTMGSQVEIVGNPWFRRFIQPDPSDDLVRNARDKYTRPDDSRPIILHTLSWGLELYYPEAGFNGVMIAALEKAILETADQYLWLLRRHPVEMVGPERARTEAYLQTTFGHLESVDWVTASEAPLPLVLSWTHAHITDMSSVVKEAAWFGIPSALLNWQTRPGECREGIFGHERKNGVMVTLPHDSGAIESWLQKAVRDRGSSPPLHEPTDGLDRFLAGLLAAKARSVQPVGETSPTVTL